MTTFQAAAPGRPRARARLSLSPTVIAVAVAAVLAGTVGVLAVARLVTPAASTSTTASADAATTAAPPFALVHASATTLGPQQVTVARDGTLALMNMGAAPVRLALQGTKVAVTVPANDGANLPLSGLKPGRYTLQAQRPDGRPTALSMRVTVAK